MNRPRLPIHLPQGALSWESQVVQYRDAVPPDEPGITYFAGDVSETFPGKPPVDALLYWEQNPAGTRLRIVGILNHYPADYPPWERAGNVNVWVRKSHQRRGIATRLWEEAVRRWNPDLRAQRFTAAGARLAESILERGDG